jgi:hypothetical protein
MLSVVMPNVIMLGVIILNVIMLSVIMPNVIMLGVVILNVIMLSVVMLNVMAPLLLPLELTLLLKNVFFCCLNHAAWQEYFNNFNDNLFAHVSDSKCLKIMSNILIVQWVLCFKIEIEPTFP